jgi:hypothetical protein
MTSLLDTCAVLWAARQPEHLSPRVRDLLLDSREELALSVVSAWEIALKPELGITDVARWFRQAARNLQPLSCRSGSSTLPLSKNCHRIIAIRSTGSSSPKPSPGSSRSSHPMRQSTNTRRCSVSGTELATVLAEARDYVRQAKAANTVRAYRAD